MRKSSIDKLKTTEQSTIALPRASPIKTKLGSTFKFKNTSKSLS